MKIHENCLLETFYTSTDDSVRYECTVKLSSDEILVEYPEDGEFVQYLGKGDSKGHYVLQGNGFDARATLHQAKGSEVLEGSWAEGGSRGMWKITL